MNKTLYSTNSIEYVNIKRKHVFKMKCRKKSEIFICVFALLLLSTNQRKCLINVTKDVITLCQNVTGRMYKCGPQRFVKVKFFLNCCFSYCRISTCILIAVECQKATESKQAPAVFFMSYIVYWPEGILHIELFCNSFVFALPLTTLHAQFFFFQFFIII